MSSAAFASTGDLQAKKISFSEVGSGLYAFTAEGDPNSGIIVGEDCCLVMDAQATPGLASLVIERGLAWPAPFELDVVGMGGAATTWKRHVYYRLSWVKASGARLAMVWAGEQPYDSANLWRAPGAFLVKVDIR